MTGTFESKGEFLFLNAESITFATTADLEVGQEVVVSANMTVAARNNPSQRSIGIVGTKPQEGFITIRNAIFEDVVVGIAKGGTLNAGALVIQDGTVDSANKLPNYVSAATGSLASGIVLSGSTAGGRVRIGVLKASVAI